MTEDNHHNEVRSVIRWEDPPPRHRSVGRLDWSTVADELEGNPARWALVHEASIADPDVRTARGIASGINTATLTAFRPAGTYEAVSRMINNRCFVYARYVGEHPDPGSAA
jgi:hypothetical protein